MKAFCVWPYRASAKEDGEEVLREIAESPRRVDPGSPRVVTGWHDVGWCTREDSLDVTLMLDYAEAFVTFGCSASAHPKGRTGCRLSVRLHESLLCVALPRLGQRRRRRSSARNRRKSSACWPRKPTSGYRVTWCGVVHPRGLTGRNLDVRLRRSVCDFWLQRLGSPERTDWM